MGLYDENRVKYSGILERAAVMASGWRLAAFISMFICLVSIVGVIWMGQKSSIEPVLVVMDEQFIPVGLYSARTGLTVRDDRVTKALLAQFAKKWRSVSIDARHMTQQIQDLRFFLENNSPAVNKIRQYLDDDGTNPLKRAERETVSVSIRNVIAVSDLTWRINWKETIAPRGSASTREVNFEAIVNFTYLDDVPPNVLLVNPTGIVIQDLNWSEVL